MDQAICNEANEGALVLRGEQGADEQPETLVRLDPEGDAILEVHDPESNTRMAFVVSSAILSMVSKYFRTLFRSNFKEGLATRRGECPRIVLKEDDPKAMETILGILHHQGPETCDVLSPKELVAVAMQSDKYDCVRVMRPWAFQWFSRLRDRSTKEDLGSLLLAAYHFQISEQFEDITARAVKQATAKTKSAWARDDTMASLPLELVDEFAELVSETLDKMQEALLYTADILRLDQTEHTMDKQFCAKCRRTLPANAKKCHPCSNIALEPTYCTGTSRVVEYLVIMERNKLFPSVKLFRSHSVSEIADRFALAKKDQSHWCAGKIECPLRLELETLSRDVNRIVSSVEGVKLRG